MTDPVNPFERLETTMRAFRERAPGTMQGFQHLHGEALRDGALSCKDKELIALAIGVVTLCDSCTLYHLRDALSAGATPEEITEAVGVAVLMGGAPAVIHAGRAIEMLERLEATPESWTPPT